MLPSILALLTLLASVHESASSVMCYHCESGQPCFSASLGCAGDHCYSKICTGKNGQILTASRTCRQDIDRSLIDDRPSCDQYESAGKRCEHCRCRGDYCNGVGLNMTTPNRSRGDEQRTTPKPWERSTNVTDSWDAGRRKGNPLWEYAERIRIASMERNKADRVKPGHRDGQEWMENGKEERVKGLINKIRGQVEKNKKDQGDGSAMGFLVIPVVL